MKDKLFKLNATVESRIIAALVKIKQGNAALILKETGGDTRRISESFIRDHLDNMANVVATEKNGQIVYSLK